MNWNQIEGNWEQFKGKVQSQWGKLTDDDLDVIKGNRRQLAGRLQKRYGKAEEEAEREIDMWAVAPLNGPSQAKRGPASAGLFMCGRV
jgi:uncharacterized protein YjbJ (UPF0337 family)